jgi:hypothetical protein
VPRLRESKRAVRVKATAHPGTLTLRVSVAPTSGGPSARTNQLRAMPQVCYNRLLSEAQDCRDDTGNQAARGVNSPSGKGRVGAAHQNRMLTAAMHVKKAERARGSFEDLR